VSDVDAEIERHLGATGTVLERELDACTVGGDVAAAELERANGDVVAPFDTPWTAMRVVSFSCSARVDAFT